LSSNTRAGGGRLTFMGRKEVYVGPSWKKEEEERTYIKRNVGHRNSDRESVNRTYKAHLFQIRRGAKHLATKQPKTLGKDSNWKRYG